MELEVYWLELAKSKLDDIYDYYTYKASRKTAKSLVDGIIDKTLQFVDQPFVGQIEENLNTRPEKFRYLIYKNYKIIYWVNTDKKRIEIANVFDTRQDPDKLGENAAT